MTIPFSRRGFLIGATGLAMTPALGQGARKAFITPDGAGDGLSREAPAPLERLNELISAVGPGGTVYLRADAGRYRQRTTIDISAGGEAGAPVTIVGVNADLRPERATIQGSRRRWRRPANEQRAADASRYGGNTLFAFGPGSSHLVFKQISLVDIGRVFDFTGCHADGITIADVDFTNIQDGIYTNEASELTNVVVRRFSGIGFSKKAIRMHGSSHDWVIQDCELDSGWQYGDNFAVGIEVYDTAHDLLITGGFTINCLDRQGGDQERYWNADGVATEEHTRNIRIVDHRSAGHTDGGYDLKSEATVLIRCVAEDNKRNYRIWGGIGADPVLLEDCSSISPRSRGGVGGAAHIWQSGIGDYPFASSLVVVGGRLVDEEGAAAAAVFADGSNVATHFVGTDLSRLSARDNLLESEGTGSRLLLGEPTDPGVSVIATHSAIETVLGMSKTVPLEADGEATWRMVGSDERFSIAGDALVIAASETQDPVSVDVQARGSNGKAIRKSLTINAISNPLGLGTALAVVFSGPDGSTEATDLTGLNQVVFEGAARIEGDALQIDGVENYVMIRDSDNFSFAADFTLDVEFSVVEPRREGGQDIVTHWGDASSQRGYMLRLEENGRLTFAWSHDGSDDAIGSITSGSALKADRFYAVRVDRKDRTIRLYVDGKVVGKARDAGDPIMNPNVPLRLSGRADGKYGATGQVRSMLVNNAVALAGSDRGYAV